jgi:hypothetical protein
MKINIEKLQSQYVEKKPSDGIDNEKLQNYLKDIYGKKDDDKIRETIEDQNSFQKVDEQVGILCSKMEELGISKFSALREKFAERKSEDSDAYKSKVYKNLNDIKDTMECIVYSAHNGVLPPEDIKAKFSDRDFACNEGTLSNLQALLAEMTIEQKDLKTLVTDAKKSTTDQILRKLLYENNNFTERLLLKRPMEIHNIHSLRNLVADDYKFLKISASDDQYVADNLPEHYKNIVHTALQDAFQKPETIETMVQSIADEVTNILPTQLQPGQEKKIADSLSDSLENCGIKKEFENPDPDVIPIENFTFINYEDYAHQDIKQNLNQIVRDCIVLRLNENKLINDSPEVNKVKANILIETSNNDEGTSLITEETINKIKDLKQETHALEYIVFNHPKEVDDKMLQYTIDAVKENGSYQADSFLDNMKEKYQSIPEQSKNQFNKKYRQIYKIANPTAPELLNVESGAEFLQPEKLTEKIDDKNFDLKLIEKIRKERNNLLEGKKEEYKTSQDQNKRRSLNTEYQKLYEVTNPELPKLLSVESDEAWQNFTKKQSMQNFFALEPNGKKRDLELSENVHEAGNMILQITKNHYKNAQNSENTKNLNAIYHKVHKIANPELPELLSSKSTKGKELLEPEKLMSYIDSKILDLDLAEQIKERRNDLLEKKRKDHEFTQDEDEKIKLNTEYRQLYEITNPELPKLLGIESDEAWQLILGEKLLAPDADYNKLDLEMIGELKKNQVSLFKTLKDEYKGTQDRDKKRGLNEKYRQIYNLTNPGKPKVLGVESSVREKISSKAGFEDEVLRERYKEYDLELTEKFKQKAAQLMEEKKSKYPNALSQNQKAEINESYRQLYELANPELPELLRANSDEIIKFFSLKKDTPQSVNDNIDLESAEAIKSYAPKFIQKLDKEYSKLNDSEIQHKEQLNNKFGFINKFAYPENKLLLTKSEDGKSFIADLKQNNFKSINKKLAKTDYYKKCDLTIKESLEKASEQDPKWKKELSPALSHFVLAEAEQQPHLTQARTIGASIRNFCLPKDNNVYSRGKPPPTANKNQGQGF